MMAADLIEDLEHGIEDLQLISMRAIDVIDGLDGECDDKEWDERWAALRLAVLTCDGESIHAND